MPSALSVRDRVRHRGGRRVVGEDDAHGDAARVRIGERRNDRRIGELLALDVERLRGVLDEAHDSGARVDRRDEQLARGRHTGVREVGLEDGLRLGDVVEIVSIARYSRFDVGELNVTFIVMIQADVPSTTTDFSCVYVERRRPHDLDAGRLQLIEDARVVRPGRGKFLLSTTFTSSPAFFFAMSVLMTVFDVRRYIVMWIDVVAAWSDDHERLRVVARLHGDLHGASSSSRASRPRRRRRRLRPARRASCTTRPRASTRKERQGAAASHEGYHGRMSEARAIPGEEVIETLGVGLAFVTFVAKDGRGALTVCKRIRLAAADSDVARMQLGREAAALAKLDGRGAPRLIASGEDDFGPYVSIEHVAGRRPSSLADARFAFEALARVHEAGVLHADLSPSNVIIGDDRAWLVDFCTAQGPELPPLQPHEFTGTIAFASPERARGETIDERADLFSLAASIVACATGLPPRAHPDDMPRGAQLLRAGETPVDEAFAALAPAALSACLAFDPNMRPKSARGVLTRMA